ncbi:MAG TPA: GvpL/GvpF family gas vesicle protein [Candidatus Angelobacter sp.]
MTKVLAYCAYLNRPGISVPSTGVNGAPLHQITHDQLGLLCSQVEWPFDYPALQRNAVEFHRVVSHMFGQGAVVPFRLLSVFDNLQDLVAFLATHQASFVADLERLQNLVQMECVLYFAPRAGFKPSGKEYLQMKADLLQLAEDFVQNMSDALQGISKEIRTRESKNGGRIFVLVERGNEKLFHSIIQELPLPERFARRLSGPWPAAEFLSDSVKMPQIAGQR